MIIEKYCRRWKRTNILPWKICQNQRFNDWVAVLHHTASHTVCDVSILEHKGDIFERILRFFLHNGWCIIYVGTKTSGKKWNKAEDFAKESPKKKMRLLVNVRNQCELEIVKFTFYLREVLSYSKDSKATV